jgi:hypothetical protein
VFQQDCPQSYLVGQRRQITTNFIICFIYKTMMTCKYTTSVSWTPVNRASRRFI